MAGVKFGELNISSGEKRAIFSSAVSFAVLNFMLGFSGFGSSVSAASTTCAISVDLLPAYGRLAPGRFPSQAAPSIGDSYCYLRRAHCAGA